MSYAVGRMGALLVADDAVASTEYALLLAVFVTAATIGICLFGTSLSEIWSGISTRVPDGSLGSAGSGPTQAPSSLMMGANSSP